MNLKFLSMKKLTIFLAFLLFVGFQAAAQMQITGTVTGVDDGLSIPGVSIVVAGNATIGTTTDIDGKYSLTVPSSSEAIVFSFVGMTAQVVVINGRSLIDVQMESEVLEMDEVIVVAYGTTKKQSFTGSAATVNADNLKNVQATNVSKALEGLAAGVQVTSGSGQPGTDAEIRIRGIGSINASAAPLYVVDGFPFDGNISNINPNDISSISILKDASATALYGSRGANGVIMITTKQGKSGESKFNFQATYGVQSRSIPEYDRVGVADYYELSWERLYNNYISFGDDDATARASASANVISNLGGYNAYNVANDQVVGTDGRINSGNLLWNDNWQDEMFRTGKRQEYVLSASGGNDQTTYYISAGYLDNDAIAQASNYKRYSVRSNITSQMKDWVKVGVNMSGSSSEQNFPESSGSAYVNSFMFTRMIAPIYPVYLYDNAGVVQLDGQGNKLFDYGNEYGRSRAYGSNVNPLGTVNLDTKLYKRDLVSVRGFTEFSFLKDFTFKLTASADYYGRDNMDHQNSKYGDAESFGGRSTKYTSRSFTFNANQLLTYDKTIDEHHVNLLVGHENYSQKYNYLEATRTGFPFPGLTELAAASTAEGSTSYEDNLNIESYLSRLNYDYAGRYYLSLSYRTDGSSRFHPDQRWGNFWSIGASWRISEEGFMSGLNYIHNARLKASYGSQGNDRLGTYYAYLAAYSTDYANLAYPGLFATRLATPELTWEKNLSTNIGLDLGLFDRVNIGAEYFIRESDDLLFTQPLAPSTGFSGYDANIGTLKNSGYEIQVDVTVIKKQDFSWNVGFNISHIKNEITKLPQEEMIVGSKKYMVGKSIYEFFIQDYAGVDPATGEALWYYDEVAVDGGGATILDDDGDPVLTGNKLTTNDYDAADKYYSGSALPDFIGGITSTLNYKGFDFSFVVSYGIGGVVLDGSYQMLMHGGSWGDAWHSDIKDRWTATNTDTDVPILNGDQNANARSTRFLVDADYLSIKNITLGYTLPRKWSEKAYIKDARVFASASNLYTFTNRVGVDPQQSLNGLIDNEYTPLKTITFGVNLNF